MTIEKAIEILKEHVDWCDPIKEVETYDALKLGIAALKRELEEREAFAGDAAKLLLGETKE